MSKNHQTEQINKQTEETKPKKHEQKRNQRRKSDQLNSMHQIFPKSKEIQNYSDDVKVIINEIFTTTKDEEVWKIFIRKTALIHGRYFKIDKMNDKNHLIVSCICQRCKVKFAFHLKKKEVFISKGLHLRHHQEKKDIISHRKKIPYENEINKLPVNFDLIDYFRMDETEE